MVEEVEIKRGDGGKINWRERKERSGDRTDVTIAPTCDDFNSFE